MARICGKRKKMMDSYTIWQTAGIYRIWNSPNGSRFALGQIITSSYTAPCQHITPHLRKSLTLDGGMWSTHTSQFSSGNVPGSHWVGLKADMDAVGERKMSLPEDESRRQSYNRLSSHYAYRSAYCNYSQQMRFELIHAWSLLTKKQKVTVLDKSWKYS